MGKKLWNFTKSYSWWCYGRIQSSNSFINSSQRFVTNPHPKLGQVYGPMTNSGRLRLELDGHLGWNCTIPRVKTGRSKRSKLSHFGAVYILARPSTFTLLNHLLWTTEAIKLESNGSPHWLTAVYIGSSGWLMTFLTVHFNDHPFLLFLLRSVWT